MGSPGSRELGRCAAYVSGGDKAQSPILLPWVVSAPGSSLSPPHLLREQSALVGRLPPWWRFFNKKNSRVIHLPRRISTSPTRCPGACVIPAGTVGGLSVTTPWLPGSFINEVCLKGSYNLPVICCIFFLSKSTWVLGEV